MDLMEEEKENFRQNGAKARILWEGAKAIFKFALRSLKKLWR
jgi:hypothetical protein